MNEIGGLNSNRSSAAEEGDPHNQITFQDIPDQYEFEQLNQFNLDQLLLKQQKISAEISKVVSIKDEREVGMKHTHSRQQNEINLEGVFRINKLSTRRESQSQVTEKELRQPQHFSVVKRPNFICSSVNCFNTSQNHSRIRQTSPNSSMQDKQVSPRDSEIQSAYIIEGFDNAFRTTASDIFTCPTTKARFVFGELGLRLLAAQKVRFNCLKLDSDFLNGQSTMGFNNKYRNLEVLVQQRLEERQSQPNPLSNLLVDQQDQSPMSTPRRRRGAIRQTE